MSNKSKFCQNRDVFSRMNFLYQASMLMAGNNNVLSAYYGSLCKNVAKKSVLRIEPDIKRTVCKKCGLVLKPGITSEINIDKKNKKLFTVECKKCNFKKNYLINPKYKFWLENPDSIVEQFDFGEQKINNTASNLSVQDKKQGKSKGDLENKN